MITRRGRVVGHLLAFLFCLWGGGQTVGKPLFEGAVLYVLVVATGLAISYTVESSWNRAKARRALIARAQNTLVTEYPRNLQEFVNLHPRDSRESVDSKKTAPSRCGACNRPF